MKTRVLKLLVSCMTLVFFVTGTVPAVSFADEYQRRTGVVDSDKKSTSKQRIVVSMGDSYSSGEGLGDYYGSSDPDSGDKFIEFLAHQSKNSWAGMLELPGVGKMRDHKARSFPDYSYDPNAKLQWYFVASSGAETTDVLDYVVKKDGTKVKKEVGQKKEYSINKDILGVEGEVRSAYFNPQISVLKYLKNQGVVPDYITLTLGGNDLGFADIISDACMENKYTEYFFPNSLQESLNNAVKKLDKGTKEEISVKDYLRETYNAIYKVFEGEEKKPCILVAGYPRLLDPNVKGVLFEKDEAKQINEKVTYFNDAIKEMVEIARDQDGIDIEYIDVETEFGDNGAYSKNAMINEVKLIPRESDIQKFIFIKRDEDWLNIASAQSMHPNSKGAKCYAECFQRVINKREKVTAGAELTPTPTPTPMPAVTLPEQTSLSPTKESTSATTSTPIGKTKVTDAYKKTYKDKFDGRKCTDRIPKVTIEGVNTSAINNEIYKKLKRYCNQLGIEYEYYIGKTYVSIIIELVSDVGPGDKFVYNISRKTGKKLSRNGMLKELGISSKTFESRTKKAIKKIWKGAIDSGELKKNKHYKSNYISAISSKTLSKAVPCVNSKGKLCFFVKMLPVAGGADCYDWVEKI